MQKLPLHIIAIGASAGGMEEIITFFDNTPLDGVAYVIIQHLSPAFKSRMVELLAKHSKLVIKEAENNVEVQSNEVYLIPNNKFMTIKGGKLHLTEKENVKGPHLTVNSFFVSLAANSGKNAIAVVLSGLGSDGTQGVKAIKEAGGLVIARNPENTEFPSMPSHAIATGLVDFILEPETMPAFIKSYVSHTALPTLASPDENKYITAILDLIKEQSPLDFSDYKQSTIQRRIMRRAGQNNFTDIEQYLDFLKATPGEIEALSKDFLISVTSFFRDKEAFEFLKTDIIPVILQKLQPGEELKMWVAGCATGEEAYSLAILIAHLLAENPKDTIVKIFATDIDSAALLFAGKGIYSANIKKHIPAEMLGKYFVPEANLYKVKPEIRKMVIFAQHDIVKNPPYCNMHLISCRNLLIYMTPVLQKKIFLMLLFGLKMHGYLFLGSSENPTPIIKDLQVLSKKWKIYKNLEAKRAINFDAFSLPVILDKKMMPAPYPGEETSTDNVDSLTDAVNISLVNELDYLVVCVNENNHVVKTYGDTTRYLLQKNFNLNLIELLPRPLSVAFNTLSISALKTNKKVSIKGIRIKHGKTTMSVTLSVNPLQQKKGGQKLLAVTFSESKKELAGKKEEIVFDEKIYLDQYTLNLEEELKDLKNKLHNTYLQLDASNENMQSFNEELLSANEEMQSANEEMQSVNEELHTINTDYQLKNKELQEINDDLNNYFRSNINGQLFVNNDLLLMKFSPGTVKQINLLPSDVGRPLTNISTNIKFETIAEDIKQVIATGTIITKEIQANDGKWYQIMTMPYLQHNDSRSGAIITFNDITQLKSIQLQLDKKNKSLIRINEDLDNFVHAASHDLLAPLSNIEMSVEYMNQANVTDGESSRFLTIINTSIKKFRVLIQDLTHVAKIESEMLATEMVDLDEIIDNIEWSLENKIKESGAVLKRMLEVKQINFPKKNLRSIVYNLISNGIKYSGTLPPVITIHTHSTEGYTALSVKDNGRGIPPESLSKVFEMYGRLSFDKEGQGIGLYLAKKIVDASGGNILVESELHKGTTFTIHFKTEPEELLVPASSMYN